MSVDDPFAPPPQPPVRRLTRTVWLVAALLVGGTVFLVVFFATPRRSAAPAASPAAPPAPSDPGFLQRPATDPEAAEIAAERQALRALAAPAAGGGAGDSSPHGAQESAARAVTRTADLKQEAFLRALDAPLVRSAPIPAAPPEESVGKWLASLPPPPGHGTGEPERTPPPHPAERQPEAAAAPHRPGATVAAGTVIPALLLTAVNSDLPGHLLAQVSRDVYDDRQEALLIPKGTRLLGRYEDQVGLGQSRLLVAWTRLRFPSGRSVDLPGLGGTDPSGAAGVPAETDRHVWRIVGDALLLSILSAGAQLSQPQATGLGSSPGAGSVAAGALGQQLTGAGLDVLHHNSGLAPTLRLPAGTPVLVLAHGDLELGGDGGGHD